MLIFLVHFPHWESHSLVIDTPAGAPAIVAENAKVSSLTPTAAIHGVESGMRLTLARYLCPQAIIMPADPQRSMRSFHRVLNALDQVCAQVYALVPGTAWMPANAIIKWHGDADAAAQNLIDAVSRYTGSDCQVGVGPGVLGAWVSVREQTLLLTDGPDARIENFPLADLCPLYPGPRSLWEETLGQLKDIGIATVAQARVVGLDNLRSRYPQVAGFLTMLLDSHHSPTSMPLNVPKTIAQEISFPSAVTEIDHVVGQLKQVSEKFVQSCMRQQVSPRSIDIAAQIQTPTGNRTYRRTWSLMEVVTTRDLLDRVRWQLQGWVNQVPADRGSELDFTDLPTGIRTVKIRARELVWLSDISPHLWDRPSDAQMRAHAGAYRLQSLLGDEQVTRIRVNPGYDPRSRVQQHVWGEPIPETAWKGWKVGPKITHLATYRESESWKGGIELPFPTTVLDEPIPVELKTQTDETVQVRPEGSLTSPPSHLLFPPAEDMSASQRELIQKLFAVNRPLEKRYFLTTVEGPWPVMGPWWRQQNVARVWVRVQCADQPAMLLAWEKPRWLLHAVWC